MNSVVNSDELRAAYEACLPSVIGIPNLCRATCLAMHRAYQRLADGNEFRRSKPAQQQVSDTLRDFRLSVLHWKKRSNSDYGGIIEPLIRAGLAISRFNNR